jgi:tryptophan halogenase
MVGQTVRDYYNLAHRQKWEAVRDFLACHYRYNTRLDTPFWLHCRHHTPLAGAQGFVEFFQENGVVPESQDLLLDPTNAFGAEGYLALLLGQAVPFKKNRPILPAWRDGLNRAQNAWKTSARHAFSVSETLTMLRRSGFSVAYPT